MLVRLFEAGGSAVTLSTIHRAKGLEWDVVLHLDPGESHPASLGRPRRRAIRSRSAKFNLRYVCKTRTKDVLVNANLEDFV